MSNLNFDDITAILERMNGNTGTAAFSVSSISYPQVKLNTQLPSLTSNMSLSTAAYNLNVAFDQDIFSEVPARVFDESYNKQMARIMKAFRNEFFDRIVDKPKKIIPKLHYHYDEDENTHNLRLTSEWSEGNAMLYFSFEKDQRESSFGLIWNDNKKKNYQARSGNLLLNNSTDIVREAIDFVFRVY